VVKGATYEEEVVGSNPTNHMAVQLWVKNDEVGWVVLLVRSFLIRFLFILSLF
jgi:hypothetical protein